MIPVAALFGTAIPNVFKALESGRLPTLAELRGTPAASASPFPGASNEAPRYVSSDASGNSAGGNVAPPWKGNGANANETGSPLAQSWMTPPTAGNNTHSADAVQNNVGPRAADVMNASYNAPVDARTLAQTPTPPAAGNGSLVQVDHVPANSSSISTNAAVVPPAAESDPFTYVQKRLRELGATYYLLESWGDRKREYRFYCKMAIGGNEQFTKAFYCVDADAKIAMLNVLQQVEGWHNGGS
jgi:hypothetical protein